VLTDEADLAAQKRLVARAISESLLSRADEVID